MASKNNLWPVKQKTEPPLEEFCQNELFDLLGNQRRRYILGYLISQNSSVKCQRLAQQVAAWENATTQKQVNPNKYQSVYNSLYQNHLPKLESAGLINYDRTENVVYPLKQIDDLEHLIQIVEFTYSTGTYNLYTVLLGLFVLNTVAGVLVFLLLANSYALLAVILGFLSIAVIRGKLTSSSG